MDPGDSRYTITGRRLRLIALNVPVKINILTKHGKNPEKCPCCFHGLRKRYTKNLAGKKLLVGLYCPKCSYKGFEGKFAPMKYEFRF